MGVSSLPKTVTRRRRDCDLNPGPTAPESSTLTMHSCLCTCHLFLHVFLFVCTFFCQYMCIMFSVMGGQLRWANAFTGSLPL